MTSKRTFRDLALPVSHNRVPLMIAHVRGVARTVESLRRDREGEVLRLRKERMSEAMRAKRAQRMGSNPEDRAPEAPEEKEKDKDKDKDAVVERFTASGQQPTLSQTVRNISVLEGAPRLQHLRALRRIMSRETVPARELVQLGALPVLVELLRSGDTDEAFEAAWTLTNVASTEETAAVLAAGVLEPAVQGLLHADPRIREQCAWCLGNIAGDSEELRDALLASPDFVANLLRNVEYPDNADLLRNTVWSLSNVLRFRRAPAEVMQAAMPLLMHTATQLAPVSDTSAWDTKSEEALTDTCWGLAYISDQSAELTAELVGSGVLAVLVPLMAGPRRSLLKPVLRVFGNVVLGSDEQTQALLNLGLLAHMAPLVQHARRDVRREAMWMLSNITAGTRHQMMMVHEAGLLGVCVQQMLVDEWDVLVEGSHLIANVFDNVEFSSTECLLASGAMMALCRTMKRADPKLIVGLLSAIHKCLQIGQHAGERWIQYIVDAGGEQMVLDLQSHRSKSVARRASAIVDDFLQETSEHEEAGSIIAPPHTNSGTAFGFDAGVQPVAIDFA
jgi:importin subunit alpha-1